MRRLASVPVGQTRVFDLVMRLFLIHVLGVRPDCVQSRLGELEKEFRITPREVVIETMNCIGRFQVTLLSRRRNLTKHVEKRQHSSQCPAI